jgi:hypothetical protein
MRTILTTTLAALALAAPAMAQQACGPRDQIVATLGTKYGEVEVAAGLSSGMAMSIYANGTTGTYTVTLTPPGRPDIACIVAVGTDWAILPAGLGVGS